MGTSEPDETCPNYSGPVSGRGPMTELGPGLNGNPTTLVEARATDRKYSVHPVCPGSRLNPNG